MKSLLTAVILLFISTDSGHWKVGAPAPGLAETTGHLAVALLGNDATASLHSGVRQLRADGVKVLRRVAKTQQAYLVDETGIVRRRGPMPLTDAELLSFVREWKDGRTLFMNRCARCHGEDGMDTSYPFISQLGGIGQRWTRSQIRAKLNPVGAGKHPILVRGNQYSGPDFEALVTFLAGL